jgi:hypothetical protein
MSKRPIYDLYCAITNDSSFMMEGLCLALMEANLDYCEFNFTMKPTYSGGLDWAPNKLFWGSGYRSKRIGHLTPLRENLLLLWACYNGEEI